MGNPVEITIRLDLDTLRAAGSALMDALGKFGLNITKQNAMIVVGSVMKAIAKTKTEDENA